MDGKKIVGIFTERDALKRGLLAGASPDTPIEKLMTPDPVAVDPDDNLAVAIRLMHEGKYRHLPIVDRNDEYLGIISVRDIVMYLSENYPYEVYNQPPDPHKVSVAPEGA
jgi:CBS domain-containing protein